MFNLIASWFKRSSGATAIEFALVSFPFIMMIVGIIEIAMMFTSAVMVEGGTGVASRLIRTCQIQDMTGDPEDNFRLAFCDHAAVLPGCDTKLMVESIAMPDDSFMSVSSYTPNFDVNGDFVPSGFDAGDSSDIVLIRVAYDYQFLTPLFNRLLGGSDSSIQFMSSTALQVEPCKFEGAI